MNTNIFRAYDIRGHAEKDLNSSTIEKIGYALGLKIKENNSNSVYIGYDSRLSCEEIKSNLIRGINAAGVKVLNLGLVPTPIVYYATKVGDTSNGNINSWVEWDNYSQVWKVYCSDSTYNGIVHCTIHTN